MTCCLFGAKPSSEPMLAYCLLGSREKIQFDWIYNKIDLKISSANWRSFRRDHKALILSQGLIMTSPNGNIFRVTGPLCGGIHRSPVNSPRKGQWRGALMFCALNNQSWGRWFETPPVSLWRHCNVGQCSVHCWCFPDEAGGLKIDKSQYSEWIQSSEETTWSQLCLGNVFFGSTGAGANPKFRASKLSHPIPYARCLLQRFPNT